jgi:Cu/Ag efflux protein CusF
MVRFATYGFAAALVGAATVANAESLTGTVQSFDEAEQVIVIEDGRSFLVRPGLDTTGLEPGTKVTLNVEQVGDQAVVTEIRTN